VSDSEIVDLDEPEPVAAAASGRIGSLAIVLVTLLAIVAIAVVLSNAPPLAAPVAAPELTRPPGLVLITAFPAPTNPPTPTAAPVVLADPEVLTDRSWSAIGPAHPARGDVAEAVLRGAIYVIGGTGTTEDVLHVYRYDVSTGARERMPDLPVSVDHAMAATLSDRIYVFGGFIAGQGSARVFSFGANDARWIEHSPMPTARAAAGIAVINERAYIVGGVGRDGNWVKDVWVYDHGKLITGFAPIPTPRDHLAVGTYRGRICAAGGNGGDRAFECYDPVRNEWARLPDLRKPVMGGRAAEAAGWFWVVAPDIHIFTIDHWHFGPRLQSPRGGGALVTIADVLYVVEGATGRATTMEMLKPQP
jgi:hypothetical protein